MKHLKSLVFASAMAFLATVSTASAYNITIYDLQGTNGSGQGNEDGETEPGTLPGQEWDFEAFDMRGTTLTLYSGFNILSGQSPYRMGDIFIDVDGDAIWAPGTDPSANGGITSNALFKFDYVVHFKTRVGDHGIQGDYEILKIGDSTNLRRTKFKSQSNPFVFDSGEIATVGTGSVSVSSDASSTITLHDGTQVTGGSNAKPHFIMSIDLGAISGIANHGTLFHLTQECGNDLIVGRVSDTGSALALLGAAMTGVSMFVRRSRKS
ncbi:MAG: hypothetical protein FJ405_05950 [Verrucomicrobia bacterium]|nr:hypothetical protein [Verrucomicrobiota bacterium]